MQWQQFQQLKINGIQYSKAELLLLADVKIHTGNVAVYEKSFFRFIAEWLSSSSSVTSKTSGSTGTPKEIELDKNVMIASAKATINFLQLNSSHNALLCLSCEHIAGKMMVVRAFVSGMNLIVTEPSSIPLENLLHEKINFAAFVPMQVFMMLQQEKYKPALQHINHIIIGGSDISYNIKQLLKTFSNNIYETFGMTETVSHIALKLLSKNSTEEYFTTLNGITVSKNANDCLVIHAPQLSSTPIETNDIVDLKNEQHFKWLGRLDNVIVSGGLKFYPESVEQKIKPIIKEPFFIAGVADEKLGSRLILLIESKENIDLKELNTKLKSVLTTYEKPKEILRLIEFIYTPNGKINRKATLQQLISK